MITKYVERLRSEEKILAKPISYQIKNPMDHPSHARKLQEMQTKSVYALCATYHEELAMLALSLIDKEIKVYKIKQMGKKVSFLDYLSFHVKNTVTSCCIERSVQNSRPMLCMGCKSGEIMIYYLDEPIIDKLTGRPVTDGRVREKLLK
jgi:hypothetical protein